MVGILNFWTKYFFLHIGFSSVLSKEWSRKYLVRSSLFLALFMSVLNGNAQCPTSSISYSSSSFCKVGTAAVAINGVQGGSFTATSGLIINASTGEIDLASSNAGNYTITYRYGVDSCMLDAATDISIEAIPNAPTGTSITICYDGNQHKGTAIPGIGEKIVWYDAITGGNVVSAPGGIASGSYTAYASAVNISSLCERPQ